MFLVSTLRNFTGELTTAEDRESYEIVVSGLKVTPLELEERDKVKTLLNQSRKTIDIVSDEVLHQALAAVNLQGLVARIRERACMITPIDEWQVICNYKSNRGEVTQ